MKNIKKLYLIIPIIILTLLLIINYAFLKPKKVESLIENKSYQTPANKYFDDDKLYECVIDSYNIYMLAVSNNFDPIDINKSLSDEELAKIKSLSCNQKGIESTKGIEKLTNIEKIELSGNSIAEIDLSQNKKLITVHLQENFLDSIDLSSNENLEKLVINDNYLESIDISKNQKLKSLSIDRNPIETIDVSKNNALEELSVRGNPLKIIDISQNKNLTELFISKYSSIEEIILNGKVKINDFEQMVSTIKKIIYAPNQEFYPIEEYAFYINNKIVIQKEEDINTFISNLRLKGLTAKIFDQNQNEITTGNIKENYKLKIYNTSEEIINIPIDIYDTGYFEDQTLYKCVLDQYGKEANQYVDSNTVLTEEMLQKITTLYCGTTEQKITSTKGIEKLTNLTSLDLSYNNLSNIDISDNNKLTRVILTDNQLSSIDTSYNLELTELNLSNNKIENLNLKDNLELKYLELTNNNIKHLNLSKNTKLERLYLTNNKLKTLDLTNNRNLFHLEVEDNLLTHDVYLYVGEDVDIRKDKGFINYGPNPNETIYYYANNQYFTLEEDGIEKDLYILTVTKPGKYIINITYGDGSHPYYVKYNGTYNIYSIKATSNKYEINEDKKTISIPSNHTNEMILNNININYGTEIISNEKYIIKNNDNIIREFSIVRTAKDESIEDPANPSQPELPDNPNEPVTPSNENIIVNPNTKVDDFKFDINTEETYKIYDKEDKETTTGVIGTGNKIKVFKNDTLQKEFTVIVKGDANGDGKISLTDLRKTFQHRLNKINLTGVYLEAIDIDSNGKISLTDLRNVFKLYLNK